MPRFLMEGKGGEDVHRMCGRFKREAGEKFVVLESSLPASNINDRTVVERNRCRAIRMLA